MYIINKETNRIEKIESTTFKQLGFRERENLQVVLENKRIIKNKLELRKKLQKYNYVLDDNELIESKGEERLNDDICNGETWIGSAEFQLIKRPIYDWKVFSSKNKEYYYYCRVINEKTNKVYKAILITDSESKNQIDSNGAVIKYEGKVICKLFGSEYDLIIIIRPKIMYYNYLTNYESFDWKRETFDALTDGQYGDYEDFDGDWDRLNDWRGA
jgi:hypothetical protein